MRPPSFRNLNLFAAQFCGGLFSVALYFQFVLGLEPCPLCIVQRIFVLLLAIVFIFGLFLQQRFWRLVQSGCVIFFSILGFTVSARQVYLQHLPPEAQPACGPGLNYMLENFPLTETIKVMFIGTGDCAKVQWTLLGVSIAGWMLVAFVLFMLLGVVQWWRTQGSFSSTV